MSFESILLKHWGIRDSLLPADSGGSRETWRLGSGDWLTRSELPHEASFRRETSLLNLASKKIRELTTPEVLPSLNGRGLVFDHDYIWRITKNIPGEKLPASDLNTYLPLISALNKLHPFLATIPHDLAPINNGVIDDVKKISESSISNKFLKEVVSWMKSRLSIIEEFPRTLTHGDFNPTNILYEENSETPNVIGILDFELCRPDPVIMDYAQLLIMLICHSNSSNLRGEVDKLTLRLNDRFNEDQLSVAAIAYWIDLHSRWKGKNLDAEEKIIKRITQLWGFIQK